MSLQAACEEKYAFDDVRAQTDDMFRTGAPLSVVQRDNLALALKDLDILSIFPKLITHKQAIHAAFLNRLIDDLITLQRLGQRDLVSLSQTNMDKAAQVFEELCQSALDMNVETQAVSRRLVLEQFDFAFTNPFRGGDGADVRSYFNLSLVFFFLLGLISLIVFCWKAYVLVFPMLKNRKSCEIPASLRTCDLEVKGHITILGKNGLRFVPEREIDSAELYDLLRSLKNLPLVEISVGAKTLSANLHMLSVDSYVSLFETSLDRATLNELYRHSKIPTRFITKHDIQSNMQFTTPSSSRLEWVKNAKAPALKTRRG